MQSLLSRLSEMLARKSRAQRALLVYLRLSDDDHGESLECEELFRLEDEVMVALEGAGAGEFDGNEIGGGYFTLYMYGSSAAQMWDAVAPVLVRSSAPVGSYVIQRFGGPGAEENRIQIGTPARQI